MLSKKGKSKDIYINEIIRITYKCNWKCKFCNVLKTNNFGEYDVTSKEVIYKILALTKKYSLSQRKNIILSFSGGEPTLDKNLDKYISLAKKIGVGTVEIQTNGTNLFKNHKLIDKYIDAGLDEIFLAQHSFNDEVNKKLGIYYKISDFQSFVNYIKSNNLHKKVSIYLNIVVTKINIFYVYDFIKKLIEVGFIKIMPGVDFNLFKPIKKISFGFVQPNGYANLNRGEVLLKYSDDEIKEVEKIVKLCEKNNILPDFHFVCPPLCILDYKKYNLEYARLKKLEDDNLNNNINSGNLETYKFLWKEKAKFEECKKCENNNYCLGFYKNWIDFVGEDYVKEKILNYLNKKNGK